MTEITIEDVLNKHWDKVGDERNGMYNAALAAMTEWASLNRQGWTRVEVVGLLQWLREQGWLHNPYVSNEEMINKYKTKNND
jgi:hypothetical protein